MSGKMDTVAVLVVILLLILIIDTSERKLFDLKNCKINDIHTKQVKKTKSTTSDKKKNTSKSKKSKHKKNSKKKALKFQKLKKKSQKVSMKVSQYKSSDDENVLVVKKWLVDNPKGLEEKDIENESVWITTADLNNDDKEDLITIPASSYCSEAPKGCQIVTFLSPDFEKTVKVNTPVLPALFPVYVTRKSKNDMRNIIINENFLCKYKKKKGYVCKSGQRP